MKIRSWRAIVPVALSLASLAHVHAHAVAPPNAAALKQKYGDSRQRLEKNAFGRPLALESRERSGGLEGEVHALLPHPYEAVREALSRAQGWCELLTLPFNLAGLPAITVPWTATAGGVPVCVQVVAPRGADWLALAVAERLESLSPWKRRAAAAA